MLLNHHADFVLKTERYKTIEYQEPVEIVLPSENKKSGYCFIKMFQDYNLT